MDIQALICFAEVAKRGNYTRAAETLYLSQPQCTRIIKNLERELDIKLINRTSKAFSLTDAGIAFYHEAEKLIQSYNDIFRIVEDVRDCNIGEVRFSSPGVLLDMYFPTVLNQFSEKYPEITFNIKEEGSKLTAMSVLNNEAELGMVMLPIQSSSQFVIKTVIQDVCKLVVRKDHPFAGRNTVNIKELIDERIITFGDTTTLHDSFINMCEIEGFMPNITYKSMMPNFIFDMVSLGKCIAVLPYPLIQHCITENMATVLLEPIFYWDIALIHKKDRYQSFAARKVLDFMYDYFEKLQSQKF